MSDALAGGRAAAAAARLIDVTGPDLYRRNAFRITGLPTDAGGRMVRERRQQVTAALAVGAPIAAPAATNRELPLPAPATSDQIREAFDDLGDAQRRIVDELFWFWDTTDATCSCARSLHTAHDTAVRAHARALDAELTDSGEQRDQQWIDAAQQWTALLRRAAFWDHVRHRMHALDDRRLDESTLDALRDTLPRALVKPVVDLAAAAEHPARLAGHAGCWFSGQNVADELLGDAAATLRDNISAVTGHAVEQLEAGRPRDAAATLRDTVVPALRRLEGLAPHQRNRRTASARNGVAVLSNNCATALIDRRDPTSAGEILEMLDTAQELATEPETRRTIEANRAVVDNLGYAGLAGSRWPAGWAPAPGGRLDMARAAGQIIVAGIFLAAIAGVIYAGVGAVAGVIAFVIVGLLLAFTIVGAVGEMREKRGGR